MGKTRTASLRWAHEGDRSPQRRPDAHASGLIAIQRDSRSRTQWSVPVSAILAGSRLPHGTRRNLRHTLSPRWARPRWAVATFGSLGHRTRGATGGCVEPTRALREVDKRNADGAAVTRRFAAQPLLPGGVQPGKSVALRVRRPGLNQFRVVQDTEPARLNVLLRVSLPSGKACAAARVEATVQRTPHSPA